MQRDSHAAPDRSPTQSASPQLMRHVLLPSATALVVANIIGSGIFTTTGFQVQDLGHPGFILLLWVVGGILAFCGAICYGELGAAMPEAGGEYVYLRTTYGPLFGFMSAFVSLIAGFSAPIAAACKGFTRYLAHFFPALAPEAEPSILPLADLVAVAVVWILIGIHARIVSRGMRFNDFLTLFKVLGIVGLILAAATLGKGKLDGLWTPTPAYHGMGAGSIVSAFATSLVFVMFCYSGWNASAYIASEIKNPQRNLPRSLLFGTTIVVLLYLGLNVTYFYGASAEELAGRPDVGLVAARKLFGESGASIVSIVLCVSILASASAMTIAGPRVYYAMGRDVPTLRRLASVHPKTRAPSFALMMQGVVTTIVILSGRIDQIQQYAGFTLSLFTSLAVSALIVLRIRRPGLARPFRTWGYPVTPAIFLIVSVWMMIFAVRGRPLESTIGLLTVVVGGLLFTVLGRTRTA